jgi:ribonucleotide reductase beta subunit family protein with ferritin-like domain
VTAVKFKLNDSIKGMTVLNTNPVDTTKQPMFFGAPQGLQRYDNFRYADFDKLTDKQLSLFWRPQEVSLNKDRSDYQQLSETEKHIFTSNLKYQIMLDSLQGRAPGMAFVPYCSIPELESAMNIWQTMEMIHSRSYTYIIKNVYPDPSDVFDHILTDERILERAQSVTKAYDDFLRAAQQWGAGNQWEHALEGVPAATTELYEIKRKLYRAMVNVYILEAIRFYVSFACSFAFAERQKMEGNAKIIKLIARDEAQHMTITQKIINKWLAGDDPDFVIIAREEEENIIQMFRDCVQEEEVWAEYLFKDGSMIGLNAKLLQQYVQWTANRRMKAIGLKPIYDISAKNNPLPWTEHWFNSGQVQVAPQETEVESYVIGGIKQDVKKDTFTGFQL